MARVCSLGGCRPGVVSSPGLVRAGYMQNSGIGRGMKVGKESIAGTMAGLAAWAARPHGEIRTRESAALALWLGAAEGRAGVTGPDRQSARPAGVARRRVAAGATALAIALDLAAGDPAIIVRDHRADRGIVQLDPCNLHPGQAEIVAERLARTLCRGPDGELAPADADVWRRRTEAAYASWDSAD